MYKVYDSTTEGVKELPPAPDVLVALRQVKTCSQPTVVKSENGWEGGSLVRWKDGKVEALSFPGKLPPDAGALFTYMKGWARGGHCGCMSSYDASVDPLCDLCGRPTREALWEPGTLVRIGKESRFFRNRYARIVKPTWYEPNSRTVDVEIVEERGILEVARRGVPTRKIQQWVGTGEFRTVDKRTCFHLCRPPNWPEEWG